MFRFVVKYLGFLKSVPAFPLLFESFLMLWTFVTRPMLLDFIDDIRKEVLKWPGTSVSMHKYGGVQFNHGGKEIGHIHGNGVLDILLSRSLKAQLIAEGLANPHHVFAKSGWISFYICTERDKASALDLLHLSYSKICFSN
ncbi:MAG TPA: luciferase family protein [Mucilaginibacter sp.]|jgi:hypothetical protein|nr:luciferase family protein [Mucilaginibacter sp.]